MAEFGQREPFKFTTFLRQKIREEKIKKFGVNSPQVPPLRGTYQQELKEIGKRNVNIKKSYELEKQGLSVNPYLFEKESQLMKHAQNSKQETFNNLYQELYNKARRLDKPAKVADIYVLARVYKFVLFKIGKENVEPEFEKDYFMFQSMFTQRLDQQKITDIESICHQLFFHRDAINASEQIPDILERQGFKYNDQTFDDLFVRSFQECTINVSTESSDEEEEREESKNQASFSENETKGKKSLITKDDFLVEEEKSSNLNKTQISSSTTKDRDLFNLDDDSNNQSSLNHAEEEESIQEVDLASIEPNKVNWFKYTLDRYLQLKDEDGNESALNNADAFVNLLTILLANKTNEEIQEDLLNLVGFHNFELLEKLIERRDIIKDQCKIINEKLQSEKQQDNYRPKNMTTVAPSNINVEIRSKKGGKKNKGMAPIIQENMRSTNYELLKRLGFDRDFIDENKRLGLQEQQLQKRQLQNAYLMETLERRKAVGSSQVFEKPDIKKDYTEYTEENDEFKYIQIVPPAKVPDNKNELIAIKDLPGYAQKAFGYTQHLNRIQSTVYQKAFKSCTNLLISAPTGAGKTNIALLTILREVSQHLEENAPQNQWDMSLKSFKIIYIAPLKALASEIVGKFQSALAYLKIQVRELTGDMNMSKQEIQETHIIVSTPEKWDVVTRKSDGMMDMVNVMIIDEIHLLNDKRGLVLECLVARAFLTSHKTQKPIRIVGLSATLPNYEDVARFIGAEGQGTFYFDSSYRPTPLKCAFYGIKNLGNAQRANNIMNTIIYDELKRILRMGKQVIIFVHKRAETHQTAKEIIEIIAKRPHDRQLFDCERSYTMKAEVQRSKNDLVKTLFDSGFSIHNAGLLRKDRNLVEKLFMEGHIKVLVSTATLAWGVNLPAYAVIIKGTKMYDSATGTYQNVGVFDVQQIFGRAGRPQFDKEGEAIILTLIKDMDEYVKIMSNKQNIESNLHTGLDNCINAEISCGTIGTLTDGIRWLKKSYYYQRLTKNPTIYGVKAIQIQEDPSAHFILYEKVSESVRRLNRMQLIRYNEQTESVYPTDMGRIASNYYIDCETMSYYMENLKPHTSEQIMLYHMAQSSEFKQLEARKEEHDELKRLIQDIRFFDIDKACFNEAHTKVLILFEVYLRDLQLKTFSLISDMAYIVQNAARLLRAIFEIAMNKNYSNLAKIGLRWCQILDKRIRPTDHPLQQMTMTSYVGKLTNQNQKVTKYGYLNPEVVFRVKNADLSMDQLWNKEYDMVGRHLGPQGIEELQKFVSYIPYLDVEVTVMPITRAILKVNLNIIPNFEWNDRWNGKSEPFWIIVDNDSEILHSEFFVLHKADIKKVRKGNKMIKNESEINLTFFVPYEISEGEKKIALGSYYNVHILSDRWYDISFWRQIELSEIQVPDEDYPHTKLLNLRPLSIKALNNEKFEQLYDSKNIKFFNPVQTQVFHTLFHTDSNVLIGAPTGSGKTIMSEFSMLRVFKNAPTSKIIYIAPLKALAKERIQDWKKRLQEGPLKKVVLELTGDVTPDLKALKNADVLITTPEKWDGISRNWQHRSYVQQVALVIIDEIHLLGQERGPVIEVIVSRMRYISQQTGNNVRFVGLSTALANAKDVADWLGIHKLGLYNFKPSVRPVPIKVFFEGFSEKHYCPRMGTMNKPAFKAIMTHSRDHPVLIFVSSRRQTRLTALDLIALCAAEQQEREGYEINEFKRPFLKMDPEEIHHISELIKDENLKQTINYGVGMHHAGLTENDRKIVEDLFVKKKIQVLVTTSTLAWGVNFPARLVIIKGTEFYDPKLRRYVDFPLTDLLQMIGRAGRPQFDETGYACVFVHEEKKNFYKKFLYEPFPVESSLQNQIIDHLNAEIASGTLLTKQNCIDYLTWTYFFRRLTKNPAYYKLHKTNAAEINTYLQALVNDNLAKLVSAKCIEYNSEDHTVNSTTLGRLASFYYLSYETIELMNKKLGPEDKISTLINTLAFAKEFSGLPVRHNEDVLNEALTHLVPLKVAKHDLENPHVKANLLLQAHLQRCPLPITDYITDTKMVLDQSIRILQGMIDVCSHKGHLQTTLNLIHIMQMIVQGQWLDQSPLLNVPHFDGDLIRRLYEKGVVYLPQLANKCRGDVRNFLNNQMKANLDSDQLKEITKAIDRIPIISLKYTIVSVDDKNEPQERESLQEGGEAMIVVSLRRLNKSLKQKAVIANFPKPKEPGYFLIVANQQMNDILAMKRVAFNKQTSKSLTIVLPSDFLDEKLELYLMCDTYIGLDQSYPIDLIQINGMIQGQKKEMIAAKKLQQQQDQQKKQQQVETQKKQQQEVPQTKKQELKQNFVDEDDKAEEAFSLFGKMQEKFLLQDILSDDEEEKGGPPMHDHIKRGIDALLDDDDEDEDETDYDNMIEKDMDNWF